MLTNKVYIKVKLLIINSITFRYFISLVNKSKYLGKVLEKDLNLSARAKGKWSIINPQSRPPRKLKIRIEKLDLSQRNVNHLRVKMDKYPALLL